MHENLLLKELVLQIIIKKKGIINVKKLKTLLFFAFFMDDFTIIRVDRISSNILTYKEKKN